VEFRLARADDLPALVALVTDGEGVVDDRYRAAFEAVERDPRNEFLVAEDASEVVACLQLTYIPGLGGHGRERAHLEAVRVRADRRGQGIGGELMRRAIERARERKCTLVQLMSNRRRTEAHRFYDSLGFAESHAGFKLRID
jgi:GNAT superfamily N-acetyltransferase